MKSFIFTLVLMCSLGSAPLLAQGRGAGAGGGRAVDPPQVPNRPEPANNRPTPDNSRGQSTDRTNGKAETRSGQANDAAQQLADNSGLSTQVAKLFPDGTDLGLMAGGFKNLGQFVAAAHVSQNLGIPFADLKTKMVTDGSSLGDAIHAIKPDLSSSAVKAETKKAEDQAKKDMTAKK